MVSSGLGEYDCSAILDCLLNTVEEAEKKFRGVVLFHRWGSLQKIADIAFPVERDDDDVSVTVSDVSSMASERAHIAINDVSKTAQAILEKALKQDVPEAYTLIIRANVLGNMRSYTEFVSLVRAFVTGIARQHRSPNSPLIKKCLQYLYENLSSVCLILATDECASAPRALQEDILTLARIQPDHSQWDACRQKLRDLQEDGARLTIVVKALDGFFEV